MLKGGVICRTHLIFFTHLCKIMILLTLPTKTTSATS